MIRTGMMHKTGQAFFATKQAAAKGEGRYSFERSREKTSGQERKPTTCRHVFFHETTRQELGKAAIIQRGQESREGGSRGRKIMAKLTKPARDRISTTKFAFPKQRKEPLENASHVRNAAARFKQVKGVTEAERRAASKRIQSAAKRYGVKLDESD
jgi:hypothetical protein